MTELCPKPVFVDDGFPPGQCLRANGHGGLCDVYDGCTDESRRLARAWKTNSAAFTEDRAHRFVLTRTIAPMLGSRPLVSCGLNPSIADANTNDHTVRKEIGFAERWGLHCYVKINASSMVATDPKVMKLARKTGQDNLPDNDRWIAAAIQLVRDHDGIFLAAWGQHIDPARQLAIAKMLYDAEVIAKCIGTNSDGSAKHPLYVPYVTPLADWTCPS